MKTQAQKYSEAVAALTHRLTEWGVDDPEAKARDFMHAMACQGWRATPFEAVKPPAVRPAAPETREQAIAAARAALALTNCPHRMPRTDCDTCTPPDTTAARAAFDTLPTPTVPRPQPVAATSNPTTEPQEAEA